MLNNLFFSIHVFAVWKRYQSRAPFRAFNDTPSPPQSPAASRNQAVPREDILGYITAEADVHQEDERASMMRSPPADSQDVLSSIVEEEQNEGNLAEIDLGD